MVDKADIAAVSVAAVAGLFCASVCRRVCVSVCVCMYVCGRGCRGGELGGNSGEKLYERPERGTLLQHYGVFPFGARERNATMMWPRL